MNRCISKMLSYYKKNCKTLLIQHLKLTDTIYCNVLLLNLKALADRSTNSSWQRDKWFTHTQTSWNKHSWLLHKHATTVTTTERDPPPSNGSCRLSSLHLQGSCPAPPEHQPTSHHTWRWHWGDSYGLSAPHCGHTQIGRGGKSPRSWKIYIIVHIWDLLSNCQAGSSSKRSWEAKLAFTEPVSKPAGVKQPQESDGFTDLWEKVSQDWTIWPNKQGQVE